MIVYEKVILQNNFNSIKPFGYIAWGIRKIKIIYTQNDAYFFLDFVKYSKNHNSCQVVEFIDASGNVTDKDVRFLKRGRKCFIAL